MMDKPDRIGELILKYLAGSIDSAEWSELEAWKNESFQNLQYFNDRIDRPKLFHDFTFYKKKEHELEETKMRIPWDSFSKNPIFPRIYIFRWSSISVAASIVLILSVGILFGVEHHKGNTSFLKKSNAIVSTTDIAPGVTKAVLTLADGSSISLDNAKKGQLALQGKTAINNSNGAITYTGSTASEELYNTLATSRGEQSPPLTLSDGTKVWLNAASSIRFPVAFIGSTRSVEISGEAYFDVTKDKTKPFSVKTAGEEVQVLGTSFDINAYSDEPTIKTSLVEGSVRIHTNKNKQGAVILRPGQQAQVEQSNIDYNDGKTEIVKDADISQAVAWLKGKFVFHSASIDAIMKQLARWYDLEVVYEGAKPDIQLSGSVSRNVSLSSVLKVIEISGVNCRIEGKKIIVLK